MNASRRRLAGAAVLLVLLCAATAGGWFGYRAYFGERKQPGPETVRLPRPKPAVQGYAGSQACVECHSDIAKTYAGHPMAQSMHKATSSVVEDYAQGTAFSPTPRRRYVVEKSGDTVQHHEVGLDAAGGVIYDQAVPVEYALGSGRRGRSYIFRHDGYLLQSPVSWYAKNSRWDLSPGYPPENHNRFERPLVERCVQCHAGRMKYAEESTSTKALRYADEPFAELSIGCERCHGPGEEHIRWRRSKSVRGTDPIVNPSRLDPPQREAVCNQCHLQGVQQILRYGRRHEDFRPGEHLGETWTVFVSGTGVAGEGGTIAVSQVEQMYASTCFQKSRGALGCITCHDPHSYPTEDQKARVFNERCQKCHADRGCALPVVEREREPALGSCIACHMPPLAAQDVPHTSQTDHRILRRSTTQSSEAPSSEDEALQVFDEFVCRLSPLELARAQGLAVAERAENQQHAGYARQAEQLLRPVAAAAPDDLDVLDSLALCCLLQGKREAAVGLWKEALLLDPARSEALHSLAMYYERLGDFRSSLGYAERLAVAVPWRAEFHRRHSLLLDRVGEGELAVAAGLQALDLDPSAPATYAWLADLYLKQNNVEANRRCREALLRLQK